MAKSKIEFIPPGFDPTSHEYKPDGPTISGCLTMVIAFFCVIGLGFFCINYVKAHQAAPTSTATKTATSTATTTNTPRPTSTGTVTPRPTATITPTPTKTPTATFVAPPTKVIPITATPNDYPVFPVITATTDPKDVQRQYISPTPKTYNWITQNAVAAKTQQAIVRHAIRVASMTETPGG